MQRDAQIVYVAHDRVPGMPHHAKAGNIMIALLLLLLLQVHAA
jgi:hypothetical protein